MNINSNVNSAIISGALGIQRASDGISQNAANLASLSVRQPTSGDPQDVLAGATVNQLDAVKQSLPQPSANLTTELVGLSVNSINAQASAKVVERANETVGTILDILA